MSAEVELRKNCPNHEQVKVPCSSFKWTLWTDIDCDLHCLLSPQRMNRCQRSEGQRGRPFAVTWSPPGLGWDRQTDRQTDRPMDSSSVTYVPASSTRLSLLIGGLLCSSPSPALKHHRGLNDPACKKYCEEEEESEEMERRAKTMTWNAWHFGKKDCRNLNWCRGGKHTKPH